MPKSSPSAPLTFDLPVSLIARISRAKRGHAVRSTSEIVHLALAQFDLASFQRAREPHQQISVRIARKQRTELARAAKRKDASIGELIRAALERFPEKSARAARTGRK
jgi:hypothetical protein